MFSIRSMQFMNVILLSISWMVTCNDYEDAVFVALTTNLTGPTNPIKYDAEEIDIRGAYDLKGANFYAFQDGYYWASMNVGTQPGYRGENCLFKGDSIIASAKTHCKLHNGITTRSRDIIVSMKAFETLHTANTYQGSAVFSDVGLQTSLILFRLSDLMKQTVLFSAANQKSFNGTTNQIIQFPEVLVNVGKGFNSSTGIFKAPISGYYFLSYNVGHFDNIQFDSVLRRNAAFMAGLESYSTVCKDMYTLSKSSLAYIRKDDLVYINMNASCRTYSSALRHITFSGFLYDPVTGQKAWSVARKTSWTGTEDLSPVPFDLVSVDIGSNWDSNQNVYIARSSGIYYITFSVGAQAHRPVDVSLMVNGQKKASLTRTSTEHNGMEVMHRSALVYLPAYSKVHLAAKRNTSIFSNEEKQTEFIGIRLFNPTP